ncbi:hypothetical protein BDV33DRAFT_185685 [Aspergillus novoparasiticus]|uniref:Uncharacterized protein n=1 Tax=Aspergillus novoparasiticus TaxID=986946 RepID=A0A5N6E792_9EURO|nr:hypothetical protein BDV33DRAFT_185685 [Aspergillus novoparasiticus]
MLILVTVPFPSTLVAQPGLLVAAGVRAQSLSPPTSNDFRQHNMESQAYWRSGCRVCIESAIFNTTEESRPNGKGVN